MVIYITLFLEKLNGKEIDDSTRIVPGITNDHQIYGKCEKTTPRKWKINQKISKTSNLWLKIGLFAIFSCSFHFSMYFPVTQIALEKIKSFSLWSKPLWLWEAKVIDVN